MYVKKCKRIFFFFPLNNISNHPLGRQITITVKALGGHHKSNPRKQICNFIHGIFIIYVMGHVGVFGKWFILRSPKGRRQGLDKLVLCDLASNRVTMVGLTLPKLSKINRYESMSNSQYYNCWLLVYLEAQTLFEDIQLMPREIVDFVGQRGGAVVYITLLY